MERDERDLEGKECEFNSQCNDLEQFNGTICKVLKRVDEDLYNLDTSGGTLWDVVLEDGTEIDAVDSELTLLN